MDVLDKGVDVLSDSLQTLKLEHVEKDGLEDHLKLFLEGGKRLDNRKVKEMCGVYRAVNDVSLKRDGKRWLNLEWRLDKTWWNFKEHNYRMECSPNKTKRELRWEHMWCIVVEYCCDNFIPDVVASGNEMLLEIDEEEEDTSMDYE